MQKSDIWRWSPFAMDWEGYRSRGGIGISSSAITIMSLIPDKNLTFDVNWMEWPFLSVSKVGQGANWRRRDVYDDETTSNLHDPQGI